MEWRDRGEESGQLDKALGVGSSFFPLGALGIEDNQPVNKIRILWSKFHGTDEGDLRASGTVGPLQREAVVVMNTCTIRQEFSRTAQVTSCKLKTVSLRENQSQ